MMIIQRVLERFEKRGIPFDSEPRLHQWLHEWAEGTLEMDELWQRYRTLLHERQRGSRRVVLQPNIGADAQPHEQHVVAVPEASTDPHPTLEPEVVMTPAPEHDRNA